MKTRQGPGYQTSRGKGFYHQNVMKLKLAIDRGGTFTDVYGYGEEGEFSFKLLSSSTHYSDPIVEGIRRVMVEHPAAEIIEVRLGTTVATNTLLEGKGDSVIFITTAGHGDLCYIGHQARPDIFALQVAEPPLLYQHVIEADERVAIDRGMTISRRFSGETGKLGENKRRFIGFAP